MRAVIQRVKYAKVSVLGETVGALATPNGVLVFLGVGHEDNAADVEWLVARIAKLRIFEDGAGKLDRSLADVAGSAMVISQFTLFGNLKKGNRPSFNRAARPEIAAPLYELFCEKLSALLDQPVARGRFGEDMQIDAVNNGPITLIVDTKDRDF